MMFKIDVCLLFGVVERQGNRNTRSFSLSAPGVKFTRANREEISAKKRIIVVT